MFKVNTDYESSLKVGCWVFFKIQCFIFVFLFCFSFLLFLHIRTLKNVEIYIGTLREYLKIYLDDGSVLLSMSQKIYKVGFQDTKKSDDAKICMV